MVKTYVSFRTFRRRRWILTTEAPWWRATERTFDVSFEPCLTRREDILGCWMSLVRLLETSSRRFNITLRRRTTETSWYCSTKILLGVSFEAYLERHWGVLRDVAITLPRGLVVEWEEMVLTRSCIYLIKLSKSIYNHNLNEKDDRDPQGIKQIWKNWSMTKTVQINVIA